jgi:hypothetical protein
MKDDGPLQRDIVLIMSTVLLAARLASLRGAAMNEGDINDVIDTAESLLRKVDTRYPVEMKE